MPAPARCWPARGSCASAKRSRPCPKCRFRTSRFSTPGKSSDLRSDEPSRPRRRDRGPPVARSRSQSHRVLAVAPPVRRRTPCAAERPEQPAARGAVRARTRVVARETWDAPGRTRTSGPLLRRQPLYPAELRGPTREDRPPGGRRATQRPEPPPIDEPEKKKNQTSKATAAMITTTMTMRSAPVIRAEPP
jgi:hypothetical protein